MATKNTALIKDNGAKNTGATTKNNNQNTYKQTGWASVQGVAQPTWSNNASATNASTKSANSTNGLYSVVNDPTVGGTPALRTTVNTSMGTAVSEALKNAQKSSGSNASSGSSKGYSGNTTGSLAYNGYAQDTGSSYETQRNNYLDEIKRLLTNEKNERDKATELRYQALIDSANAIRDNAIASADAVFKNAQNRVNETYDTSTRQARESFEKSRNNANLNNAYTQRWLRETYGNGVSGLGLSNTLRANTNYNNTLNSINTSLANALSDALGIKNNALSEADAYRRNSITMADKEKANALKEAESYRISQLADAVNNYTSRYTDATQNLYGKDLDYEYRTLLARLGL